MQTLAKKLTDFIVHSPTPFHAVAMMKNDLNRSGFIELQENTPWNLQEGSSYYVTRNDSSIIAFTYPDAKQRALGYKMVGAHTDSPTLKIKPNPERKNAGVNQLGVEVYGGALLNPWFDRDLSIAGRVSCENSEGKVLDKMIDFKAPIAFIPSLAIHLDREVNNSRTINAQEHLPVVIGLESDKSLHEMLMEALGDKDIKDILSYDLLLYDTQAPQVVGLDKQLFTSARLDNLLSCYCGLESLMQSSSHQASLLVCNDHEEIGSRSSHGAQSNFLELVLKRIAQTDENFAVMMHNSFMISADNAHALHPNYQAVYEENHAPHLGKGVVIKYNADQSYATDSQSAALFKSLAKKASIALQSYVVRSDQRCGSTIGPITATKLGVKTIDIGIPTWAMHSIRESAALKDVKEMIDLLTLFYDLKS